MSQTCNLVRLLLLDVRDLGRPQARKILVSAWSRGVLCGAVGLDSPGTDTRALLEVHADILDFWFIGAVETWPFERAITFAGVEAARTCFVSTATATRCLAHRAGMQTSIPDPDALSRMLP